MPIVERYARYTPSGLAVLFLLAALGLVQAGEYGGALVAGALAAVCVLVDLALHYREGG